MRNINPWYSRWKVISKEKNRLLHFAVIYQTVIPEDFLKA
jgi:hypothetical protein